jgi:hypothetical protein
VEVFTAATLAALVVKITSVLKYLTSGAYREGITQVVPWVAGVIGVMVMAQADVSSDLVVWGTQTLGSLNTWSQVLAGVALGSTGSFAYDYKKAIDGTDSAGEPPLGGAPSP